MSRGDFTLDGSPQDARATLIAYITHTLSPEERESFERSVLDDDFFSGQIGDAEFVLVDEYVAGSLPEPLRHAVAAWVASSEHWSRHAEITRSLVKVSSSLRGRHFRRVLVGIAAVVCVAAGIAYSLLRPQKPGSAAQTVAKAEVSGEHIQAPPPDTILLVAERLRSAGAADRKALVYQVHSGAPVRLQIVLPASHTNSDYAVAIRRSGTGMVMNFPKATVRGPAQTSFLELILPPNTLKAGEYAADVSAPNDSYEVRFEIGK
jgi:hypothetical protein